MVSSILAQDEDETWTLFSQTLLVPEVMMPDVPIQQQQDDDA